MNWLRFPVTTRYRPGTSVLSTAFARSTRSRWWTGALLLSAATLLGMVEASQVQYDRALRGEPITWGHALTHGLPRWYAWALVLPLILLVARRIQRAELGRTATLLLHVPAGAAITLLQVGLFSAASNRLHGGSDLFAHLRPAFLKYVGLTFLSGLVTYALIVAGWYGLDLYHRYRERERTAARLDLQASELRTLLAESRLRQLQSQLQPHFLFNTLHALSNLVLKGESVPAVRMIARLGELLRRSLRAAEHPEIPLDEELRLLEDYLAIQRLRFDDRLEVVVDATEESRGALVPTLVLQPLVENAVRHGIEADPDARRIVVCAERDGGDLRLMVHNDGPDLDFAAGASTGEGVGLRNTRARLSGLYDDRAQLHLENATGGGVVARIVLPFRSAVRGTPEDK